MKIIPLTEAKSRFYEIAGDLNNAGETVTISRRGVPAAVLMGSEKYELITEEIKRLSKTYR